MFLTNLRKYELSSKARVLVLIPYDRIRIGPHPTWFELQEDFKESKFFFYNGTEGLAKHINTYNYIPLLRPYLLDKHFTEFPELGEHTIYYSDVDTCFTKDPEFLRGPMVQDDTTYYSYTGAREIKYNYQNVTYFDGKVKDVMPEKLEQYKTIDVLQGILDIFELKREFAEAHNEQFGGVQYLFKNIDGKFWKAVYAGCIYIKNYLRNINRIYFESEDKGFQSWCADLWSINFNLWRLGQDQQTPTELDFCWATDLIEKWDKLNIYHDAGASTRAIEPGHYLFNKRDPKYINNLVTPFQEDLSWVSQKYCGGNYVKIINEAKGSFTSHKPLTYHTV